MAFLMPRRTKPADFVRVNRAHPQAKDLAAFLWYSSDGTFYDAVTQKRGTTNAHTTTVASSEGSAIHLDGSAQSTHTNLQNSGAVNENNTTVVARLRLTVKPASSNCSAITYGNSSSRRGSLVGFNPSGQPIGGYFTSAGYAVSFVSGPDRTEQWVTLGGRRETTGIGICWIDGVRQSNGSISGSDSNVQTANQITFGKEPSNYNSFFTGDIAWVACFNRLLSDDDHKWWAEHAFEVLESYTPYYFFSLSAGGGGGPTNITLNLVQWLYTGTALQTNSKVQVTLTQKQWAWTGTPLITNSKTAIALILKQWSWTGTAVLTNSKTAFTLIQQAWNWAGNAIGVGGTTNLTLVKQTWNWTGTALLTNSKTAITLIKQLWTWTGSPVLTNSKTALALISKAWNWTGTALITDSKTSITLIQKAWNWTGNAVGVAGATLLTLPQTTWNWIARVPGGLVPTNWPLTRPLTRALTRTFTRLTTRNYN